MMRTVHEQQLPPVDKALFDGGRPKKPVWVASLIPTTFFGHCEVSYELLFTGAISRAAKTGTKNAYDTGMHRAGQAVHLPVIHVDAYPRQHCRV
jgi:hypothetical protein